MEPNGWTFVSGDGVNTEYNKSVFGVKVCLVKTWLSHKTVPDVYRMVNEVWAEVGNVAVNVRDVPTISIELTAIRVARAINVLKEA